MRIRTLLLLASIVSFTFSTSLNAAPILVAPAPTTVHPVEMLFKKLASMKTRDYQGMLGHRLSLKERIMFLAMRERARHYVKHGMSQEEINQIQKKLLAPNKKTKKSDGGTSQGRTALIFGIIAAATLVGGLFVGVLLLACLIASILAIAIGSSAIRKNPDDSNAHTGKLLGWVSLGLLVALLIAAVILISSWGLW